MDARPQPLAPYSGTALLVGVLVSLVVGFSLLVWVQSRILDTWSQQELTELREAGVDGLVRELRGRVDSAHSVARSLAESDRSTQEAQALAMEAISSLRFDQDNYVWVHRLERDRASSAYMLVHAASDLQGRDLSGLIDLDTIDSIYQRGEVYPKGDPAVSHIQPTDIFLEFNRVVLREGAGVVRYYWPKVVDGQRSSVGYQKISYVRLLEPWDWVIGSGTYADDVDAEVAHRREELLARDQAVQRNVIASVAFLGLGVLTLILFMVFSSLRAQQRMTEVLRESERRYKGIFEGVGEALFVVDPDTWEIRDANQPALDLYGRTREEILGRSAVEVGGLPPPYDGHTLRAHFQHAREQGRADFRWLAFRSKGRDFWADISLRLTELAGRPRMLLSIRDVTERQEREDELRRVEAGVRGATEAISMLDPKGRHFYQNPAYRELFGYTLDQVRELGPQVVYADTREAREIFGVVLSGRSWRGEVRMRHQEGHVIDVNLRVDSVLDARGELLAAVAMHTDITEARASKAALEQALTDAQAAVQAKGRFLANMSHEIRTPMNGALGMLELLLDTGLDPVQRDYAQTAHQSATDLLSVVDDVLDYSRIEAGRVDLEVVSFSLRGVLDAVAVLAGRDARAKGLLYLTLVDPVVPRYLVGDPGRLRQILLNLASNAVKFTEVGRVEVRVSQVSAGVRFDVVDTGPGLDAERVPELLQPFTQADASTTRRYGGTGLGLAISAGLVGAMGGELQAEGAAGRGSRFWFTLDLRPGTNREPLPLLGQRVCVHEPDELLREELLGALTALGCQVVEEGEAVPIRAEDGGYRVGEERVERPLVLGPLLRALGGATPFPQGMDVAPVQPWEGRTVLVVEDNAVNRRLVAHLLEKRGFDVELAEDGEVALELDGSWDLVLMDCQMPRVDGYEATRRLRERGYSRPIIALTAHALPGDRERCLDSGMDDYLTKPLQPGVLDTMLRHWLGGSAAR